MNKKLFILVLASLLSFANLSYASSNKEDQDTIEILNVSYDPTRELYQEYNQYFTKYWQKKTSQTVRINQLHGASSKQADLIIKGLEADVVTLALSYDIDLISKKTDYFDDDWEHEFPHNSSPYTSTIVFLVKKDNPKNIKDWDDLTQKDLKIITQNPKASGGARWSYMAVWAYADQKFSGDEKQIKNFLHNLYANVTNFDEGARQSTINFQNNKGDVLITWENEALRIVKSSDKYKIITPSISIITEPPIAVVKKIAKEHETYDVAEEYLEQLYSYEGQEIIAKNFYRSLNPTIIKKYHDQFPELTLVSIKQYGDWHKVQKKHFAKGGIFDQLMAKK